MGRTEADGLKKISVAFLNKHGYFEGYQAGTMTWTSAWGDKSSVGIAVSVWDADKWMRINYRQTDRDTGAKQDFDYKIPLTITPCRYGGHRYWFTCSMSRSGNYCGRRVGTLYKNGDYFACRHCYRLTYASRKQSGRYKGFVSAVDVDEAMEKVRRTHYAGKPTRKYRRYLKLEQRFELGFMQMAARLMKIAD